MNTKKLDIDTINLIENMIDGFVIHNPKGEIIHFNQTASEILSLTADQLLGITPISIKWRCIKADGSPFPGEEHPASITLATGKDCKNVTMGVDAGDSGTKWIKINSKAIYDNSNQIKMVIVSFHNITENIELANNLKIEKDRLDIAMKSLKFGVWDWNLKTGELIWDDYMYDIFGIKKENFTGAYDAFEKTLAPGQSQKVQADLEETFKNQTDYRSEFSIKKPNGEIRLIRALTKCHYDEEGKISRIVGINCDITQEREENLKLIQASKLNTLGELSAGVAHEINNPLTIISGQISIAEIDLRKQKYENLNQKFEVIKKSIVRISKIVNSLKRFSRQEQLVHQDLFNFDELYEDCRGLFETRLKSHQINLMLNNQSSFKVLGSKLELSQVLVNLIINSIHALESIKDSWIKIEANDIAGQLVISVTDAGQGIPFEIANKLFQPFYTTKEVGKGTGLGLSISKGIVDGHKGKIYYDNKSANTCFVIEIPKT